MRLKTFTAKTMKDAMAQVRDTLGPDAIIVNSRSGGKNGGVRVTAALEGDAMPPRPVSAPRPKPVAGARLADLVAEADTLAFEHEVNRLDSLLDEHRLPEDLKHQLMDVAKAVDATSAHMALAAALDNEFTFRPLTRAADGPLIFVGPPGGGKTASIAKLAAAAVLDGQPVRLITTDTVRSGGVAQLEGYAALLELNVVTADSPEALYQAVDAAEPGELVLVDSAGCNPYGREDLEATLALIEALDGEAILVMPAGGDREEAAEVGEIFSSLGCRRMIVTRLDTTRRYASLLTLAQKGGLAFAGVSAAPYVADGIQPLNPVSLARLMTARPVRPKTSGADNARNQRKTATS